MKKRNLLLLLLLVAVIPLTGTFGPWFAPGISVVIITAILRPETKSAIWLSASVMGLIFLLMAAWMLGKDASGIIGKTGQLLGGLSPAMMVLVTALTGFITGLVSGWLGSALGNQLRKEN